MVYVIIAPKIIVSQIVLVSGVAQPRLMTAVYVMVVTQIIWVVAVVSQDHLAVIMFVVLP